MFLCVLFAFMRICFYVCGRLITLLLTTNTTRMNFEEVSDKVIADKLPAIIESKIEVDETYFETSWSKYDY